MSNLFRRDTTATADSAVSRADLTSRSEALAEALRMGAGRLPAEQVTQTQELLRKVDSRTSIAGSRTVVVLAGATGSGKSSLFNALVGEPVSRIGARRPTTSVPSAAVWGDEPSGELLDWLKVGARHQVPPTARRAETLDGLVLLDLPDFDSRVAAHRAEADRVIGLADVFIWVTDPQKYADAVLHDDYVKRLAGHNTVTLVVLNQIDRLTRPQVAACVDDLHGLLTADGLKDVTIIPTSAARGIGLDDVAGTIAAIVQERNAAEQRLLADLRGQARTLLTSVAPGEATLHRSDDSQLNDALARAAGVPAVVSAVERDYRMQSVRHGGWPFTRWVHQLRPAPLRRLGLDKVGGMTRSEAKRALGRSSVPPPTPAARAAVDLATRKVGQTAAEGLPAPWADAVHDAATPSDQHLHDALDQAVLGTTLRERSPIWWTVASVLQWIFAAAVIVGLLWLVLLAALGFGQIHVSAPTWLGIPIPLWLLVVGVLAGLLLALLSRWFAARGARRRAEHADRRLRKAVSGVAAEQIHEPVARILREHRHTREALETAAA
ncbi:GTPase [Flexivirga meconopsidis]|uniref:GTPase n=1 Tax=Flexivirga meconopsidis TaxID=2977121 RepID=UPI00223ECC23|nr:GTPase [Flexivirga meconopsidis]